MKVCKLSVDPQQVASQVASDIKHICKRCDKRFSGSQGERDSAIYLASKLTECTEDVRTETFDVHPHAYFGWIEFTVTCTLLAFVAYFFSTLVSILLLLAGVIPYFVEYVLFKRMYDPLFKKETSQNVYAVKHCSGEVKKRIVFVAHYDAGNEWHTKYALGNAVFVIQRVLNIAGGFYLLAIDIARHALVGGIGAEIASGEMLYAGLAGIFFVIPWAATYFFLSKKRVIDAANDGLSGALTMVHTLKNIKDVELENTEVGVLLAGSGAVGMRGAMAFADAHKNEFGDETVFIAMNILREKEFFRVNAKEFNGFVKSDPRAVNLAVEAAKAIGINCSRHTPIFSNTESGALSAAGLRSVGINAANRHMPDYYRTRYDSFDNLSEDCIGIGFELLLKFIGNYSEEVDFELARSLPSAESNEASRQAMASENGASDMVAQSDEGGADMPAQSGSEQAE